MTATDITAWLQALGLGNYAQRFLENDITISVLPELTDDDLVHLGLSLGHRRLMQKAILALGGSEYDASGPEAAPSTPVSTTASRTGAERRHLTVVFVDLVGSTSLSTRLDPEEMGEVIRNYQNAVAGEISRFDGYVARCMGDGVLAYFGWPRAHEDDAERAVRAGLSVLHALSEVSSPEGPVAARIGIATGLVVVGDLVGEGAAQEETVVGETPNLAARLQGVAEPGQVVIAESTQRLLGERFELSTLRVTQVKGIEEPVGMYVVLGILSFESRFEAHGGDAPAPMVGRDPELNLLLERWGRAKAGEGQGVLLSGEAGIGKSRITSALFEAVAEAPHSSTLLQCSPFHSGSTLWPVIQRIGYAADLDGEDPLEARLDRLEAMLERADVGDTAPLVADLLGLDGTARYGRLDLTPQQQRTRTLEALTRQMLGVTPSGPRLLVVEDVHWIDPTTLELIELCLDGISAAPVLILLTTRLNQGPSLSAHPHITRLTLTRLSRAGVEAIVRRLGGKDMPPAVVDTVVSRTDGVPLFVEELTKAILGSGDTVIPESLHDSLMARLDRIPAAREVAQIAACIGREFTFALLSAVVDRPERDLRAALDELVASELVFCRGVPPDATYSFKHALVSDAAHESMLKTRRRAIHATLLETLQRQGDASSEMLARHAEDAGRLDGAVEHWIHAAETAAGGSAYREAASHYEHALRVIQEMPESAALLERSIDTRLALRNCLTPLGEARRALSFAREAAALAEQLDDEHRRARAASYVSIMLWHNGRPREALPYGRDASVRAARVADSGLTVGSRFFLGQVLHSLGEFPEARRLYEQVVDTLGRERESDLCGLTFLPASHARSWLTLILAELGEFDAGERIGREAVRIAEAANQPFSLQQAYWGLGYLHARRGDLDQAASSIEKASRVSDAWGLAGWYAPVSASMGMLRVLTGAIDDGVRQLESAVESMRSGRDSTIWLAQGTTCLARAHLVAGRIECATAIAKLAVNLTREREQKFDEAWALHLRGDIAMEAGHSGADEAEGFFRDAHASAKALHMRPLQAHCTLGLALADRARGDVRSAADGLRRALDDYARLAMPAWQARASQLLTDLA